MCLWLKHTQYEVNMMIVFHRFIPRVSQPERLYSLDVTPVPTTIVVNRNPTTGKLIGFSEVIYGITKNAS